MGRGGIGTVTLLGLVLVGLKLTDQIDWPWWLVTLTFWGGAVLAILMTAFGARLIGMAAKKKLGR